MKTYALSNHCILYLLNNNKDNNNIILIKQYLNEIQKK